jgi:hypothetical protein
MRRRVALVERQLRNIQVKRSVFPMSLFDRVDAVGVEGEIIFDERHRCVGGLIGPHGVRRTIPAMRNAKIGAVALIRAISDVFRAFEQHHVYVVCGARSEPPYSQPRAE